MSTWLSLVVALVSAVIGGVISPYLLGSRERWAARSKVLEVVRQTEHVWRQVVLNARGEPDVATRKIEAAITDIEIAAMIARAPRPLIDNYTSALRAVEKAPMKEGEFGGWDLTDKAVEQRLKDTREALIFSLWHPVWGAAALVAAPERRARVKQ